MLNYFCFKAHKIPFESYKCEFPLFPPLSRSLCCMVIRVVVQSAKMIDNSVQLQLNKLNSKFSPLTSTFVARAPINQPANFRIDFEFIATHCLARTYKSSLN